MQAQTEFQTRRASATPDAIAPDGSEVRILCGGMALFTLQPGAVERAVAHRTVDEIWYVIGGAGRIWRRLHAREEIVALLPGVSVSLPVGISFQFRSDSADPLVVVGVTMPPWPGAEEAVPVGGAWTPTA